MISLSALVPTLTSDASASSTHTSNRQHKLVGITAPALLALGHDTLGGGHPNLMSSDEFEKKYVVDGKFYIGVRCVRACVRVIVSCVPSTAYFTSASGRLKRFWSMKMVPPGRKFQCSPMVLVCFDVSAVCASAAVCM